MSEVSTISSARSRIRFSRCRSSRMPSLTERSGRQRMRTPRLAESPHQRRVARFEENQHRVQPRHLAQPPEDLRERRQEAALADVDDDRDLLDVAAGAQRQLRQRRDQRGRQVVDAEVAEILQRANRLRLARSGQTGEDDERRAAPGCAWPGLRSSALFARLLRRLSSSAASRLDLLVFFVRRRRRGACSRSDARADRRARGRRGGRAARSSWLRAATSTRIAMLRPGATGIRMQRHAQPENLVERVVEAEPLVLARRHPSARAARRARPASTIASTRCRTAP